MGPALLVFREQFKAQHSGEVSQEMLADKIGKISVESEGDMAEEALIVGLRIGSKVGNRLASSLQILQGQLDLGQALGGVIAVRANRKGFCYQSEEDRKRTRLNSSH